MSETASVIMSVGSNCGDRSTNVSDGIRWLREILEDTRISTIYSTGDCHGGPRDYFNAVVKGKTTIAIERLEEMCKEYENAHGRTAEVRAVGDVPIDIDIVVYENIIVRPKDYRQQFFQIGYKQLQ